MSKFAECFKIKNKLAIFKTNSEKKRAIAIWAGLIIRLFRGIAKVCVYVV